MSLILQVDKSLLYSIEINYMLTVINNYILYIIIYYILLIIIYQYIGINNFNGDLILKLKNSGLEIQSILSLEKLFTKFKIS